MVEELRLNLIRTDGGTQPRGELVQDRIEQMAVALDGGDDLPAVIVFHDGEDYWLADGFHRLHAHKLAALTLITCDIRQGTQADAQWHSYSANKRHDTSGLPRTNADKKRAVEAAVSHANAAKMSDRAIAEHVGVSAMMVNKYRPTINGLQSRQGKDGRTINTSNIGRKPARDLLSDVEVPTHIQEAPNAEQIQDDAPPASTQAPAARTETGTGTDGGEIKNERQPRHPHRRGYDLLKQLLSDALRLVEDAAKCEINPTYKENAADMARFVVEAAQKIVDANGKAE